MGWVWAAEAGSRESGGGYWHLVVVLAGIGFLGAFARWRRRRGPPPVDARELRARDEHPDRYRDAADRAIVELLETSRALNAQVDNKIRVLNRLVKEAEESCARLERLLAETRGEASGAPDGGAGPSAPTGAAGVAPAAGPRYVSELQERICRLKREGRSLAEIAKATSLSTTEVRFALEHMRGDEGS